AEQTVALYEIGAANNRPTLARAAEVSTGSGFTASLDFSPDGKLLLVGGAYGAPCRLLTVEPGLEAEASGGAAPPRAAAPLIVTEVAQFGTGAAAFVPARGGGRRLSRRSDAEAFETRPFDAL